MGAPYSQDLRQRVVGAIDGGMSKMKAHTTFWVSRTTIDDWLKQREAVGHLEANTGYVRGPLPKIRDLERFEAFALRHQGQTLGQMKGAWQEETGQSVSEQTLSVTLAKMNWTRKKRASSSPSA